MGANAQTTVPTFTAGQILTAAQQNDSARTGVPVFATTVTRDAGFGGSGEKTLAEGQLCYVEGTGLQTYNGSSWVTWGAAPSGGLTLISSTTIGNAVSTVTVSSAFSSTYANYRIVVSGGAASATGNLKLTLGATATGYYSGLTYATFAGVAASTGDNNATSWAAAGSASGDGLAMLLDLLQPNLAKVTSIAYAYAGIATTTVNVGGFGAGFLNDTTQYTAFTIAPASGTLTGGTIRVYGYQNS